MTINSDTTDANYSGVRMDGPAPAAPESATLTGGQARFINYYGYLEANLNATTITQLLDYSATDKHKTYLSRSGNANNGANAIASRWANNSAISSLSFDSNGGQFRTGSTFALYGIAS